MGDQSDGEIEDWELWADPREIERRKAERARARVPPEERRKQVSTCVCSCGSWGCCNNTSKMLRTLQCFLLLRGEKQLYFHVHCSCESVAEKSSCIFTSILLVKVLSYVS